MDFQELVDKMGANTCIISIEKKENGYGQIKIVAGNSAYLSAAMNDEGNLLKMDAKDFVLGLPYESYIPKDINFENSCYQCAVMKKPIHSYIHLDRYDLWFNIFMLPLESDDERYGYCTYTQELSHNIDAEMMAKHSASTSAEVLKTCIKLHDTNDFRKTMSEVIKDIRNICKADYCCILLMDYDSCSVLCEDRGYETEVPFMRELIDDDFFKLASSWLKTINGSNCIIVQNESDMEYIRQCNEKWYESLKNAGVESLALFPLNYNNENLGFIWVTEFDVRNILSIKETLELTTFFLASEIANFKLLNQLKKLSSTDVLTGLKNRNAMDTKVNGIINSNSENYGIICADLNGLKKVNDEIGHFAGDKLLRSAADILSDIFRDYDVYRVGGDEFMVIVQDISKEEFEKILEDTRRRSKNSDKVSLAVGGYYDDDIHNIKNAILIADKLMYDDKRKYYQKMPEKRRT